MTSKTWLTNHRCNLTNFYNWFFLSRNAMAHGWLYTPHHNMRFLVLYVSDFVPLQETLQTKLLHAVLEARRTENSSRFCSLWKFNVLLDYVIFTVISFVCVLLVRTYSAVVYAEMGFELFRVSCTAHGCLSALLMGLIA